MSAMITLTSPVHIRRVHIFHHRSLSRFRRVSYWILGLWMFEMTFWAMLGALVVGYYSLIYGIAAMAWAGRMTVKLVRWLIALHLARQARKASAGRHAR